MLPKIIAQSDDQEKLDKLLADIDFFILTSPKYSQILPYKKIALACYNQKDLTGLRSIYTKINEA